MILCLDAGNTRLKWGCGHAHDNDWLEQGAVDYADIHTIAAKLPEKPERIIACNVAGATVAAKIEHLAFGFQIPLQWFVSSESACGVKNGYAQATQLGADRWAGLLGAHEFNLGPMVVVLAGTATTIDQLDADSVFRGGLILPGLHLMRASLARNTANLPLVSFAEGQFNVNRKTFRETSNHLEPVIPAEAGIQCSAPLLPLDTGLRRCDGFVSDVPTTTDDAIVSGSVHATLGAIERMRRVLEASTKAQAKVTVVLSGGAADELLPHIASPARSVENLVLNGLRRVARTPGELG